jgi:ATP-dependent Clp protease ATP-binding subunit ClpB
MALNPNMLTEKASQIVSAAIAYANDQGHSQLVPAHMMHALLQDEGALTPNVLQRAGGNPTFALAEVKKLLQKLPTQQPPPTSGPSLTQALLKVFQDAESLQKKQEDSYVSVDHLFLALLAVKEILQAMGVNKSSIEEAIKAIRGSRKVHSKIAESTYDSLSKYAVDLTAQAEQGKLDPVIGRDDEIRRVIGVLARRRKNNPVLIGEPGVGKVTAHIALSSLGNVDGDGWLLYGRRQL